MTGIYLFEILALILAGGILVGTVYMIIGEFLGAPYVPSPNKITDKLLAKIKMQPGKLFFDLGSGDGRVVRAAVKKYHVRGVGIEIHPWLILVSRLFSLTEKLKGSEFRRESFWKTDLSNADYIYCYLWPSTMEKLAKKLDGEVKKGAVIISKAFEIKPWKSRLTETMEIENKKVYVYKV